MDRTELRSLIRSVLSEELGRLQDKGPKAASVKQENVTIGNDHDLAIFVKRLAGLCKDETKRNEIEQGRWRFTLTGRAATSNQASHGVNSSPIAVPQAGSAATARFDKGFINERQIDALSDDTEVVVTTGAVRFTPLARDRLRQRGIRIERKAS